MPTCEVLRQGSQIAQCLDYDVHGLAAMKWWESNSSGAFPGGTKGKDPARRSRWDRLDEWIVAGCRLR